jgi:hypothetical protein
MLGHTGYRPAFGLLERAFGHAKRRTRARVVADGKYLALAGRRFRVRGVTYGRFLERCDGALFPETPAAHEPL